MRITRTRLALALSALVLLGLSMVGSVQVGATTVNAQPVPPDSFLRFRVDTVQQLINQINADPAVRHRYCQLFNVPPSNLVSYVQKNVVESYVPATKTYRVWCVSKSGKLYAIHARFTSGTRVFALRNGTPVMKWACGNPVVSMLPAPPAKPQVVAMSTGVPAGTVRISSSVVPIETPTAMPYEDAVSSIPFETDSPVPQSKVAASIEQIGASHASGNLASWLPFAGAAALFTGSGGSSSDKVANLGSTSGSGSGRTRGTIGGSGFGSSNGSLVGGGSSSNLPDTPNQRPITPEPDPAITLLFGLILLAGFAMYSRRSLAGNIMFRP